jgi:hypothetical protein
MDPGARGSEMSHILFRNAGGSVTLPDPRTIMIDRRDGGQLVVHPPRRVWDRTALDGAELTQWNLLVAATAAAMLDTLPQLREGCVNYWDAGNWSLNAEASPEGLKSGPAHRVLHQHLVGRSPESTDPSWAWGEAPFFPPFTDRFAWSEGKAPLTPAECVGIVERLSQVLIERYGVIDAAAGPVAVCARCGYPAPAGDRDADAQACPRCAAGASR